MIRNSINEDNITVQLLAYIINQSTIIIVEAIRRNQALDGTSVRALISSANINGRIEERVINFI